MQELNDQVASLTLDVLFVADLVEGAGRRDSVGACANQISSSENPLAVDPESDLVLRVGNAPAEAFLTIGGGNQPYRASWSGTAPVAENQIEFDVQQASNGTPARIHITVAQTAAPGEFTMVIMDEDGVRAARVLRIVGPNSVGTDTGSFPATMNYAGPPQPVIEDQDDGSVESEPASTDEDEQVDDTSGESFRFASHEASSTQIQDVRRHLDAFLRTVDERCSGAGCCRIQRDHVRGNASTTDVESAVRDFLDCCSLSVSRVASVDQLRALIDAGIESLNRGDTQLICD